MYTAPNPVQPPALSLGDIYYVLFRHKWKIFLCILLGVAGAAGVYLTNPPVFVSEAKLYVRYIISENKALRPGTQDSTAKSPDQRGETIMKSEAEILGSLDLAQKVVETYGAEKLLAAVGGGRDPSAALAVLKNGLVITVAPGSTVMHVAFKHPDPTVVQPVLTQVIERYLKLHVETHTASGMLGDFLSQETDQLRARLSQTEEELRRASNRAGVISLEDAKKAFAEQLAVIRRELFSAQADLAQREAILEEIVRGRPQREAAPAVAEPVVPPDVLDEYHAATTRVELLQRLQQALLTQFTAENVRVRELRAEIMSAEAKRRELQEKHPALVRVAASTTQRAVTPDELDPLTVSTQITALRAKLRVLNSQFEQVRSEIVKVDQMEGTIVELRRKKELEEANFRYFSANLEQSRINETLGNGRVSNISQIQTPCPPFSERGRTNKLLGLILACGLFGGIGWAFLIEQYLDRSIKRPVDIERMLRIPLFISIPAVRPSRLSKLQLNGHQRLLPSGEGAPESKSEARAISPLEVFHETLRDRLIAYFESINLTHKPKLVAITGLGSGAGVTTTAAGLARSLSETGEGNVLLVDMNAGEGVAQQFVRGRQACGLDELLHEGGNAHVEEKLYVVAENNSDRLTRSMPQRFTKLVPKLKASDFDYILFDMPPVSQISITPRLAGFMDMVLIVAESEKTGRDVMQRATSLLGESRAHIGVVLNKTRSYVPARLDQESLANC